MRSFKFININCNQSKQTQQKLSRVIGIHYHINVNLSDNGKPSKIKITEKILWYT